ncbi:hypothetical protein [Vibrio diazotrophicus]|uniref:hypothetical protein n=1 Tax=Vibrio diazotrophicus TaxID=685 RepID=UPI000C9DEF88|nr:hypothetical protein [Vibrio diazotrophicus]PNH95728.1 hypothetical protein C1O24_13415 [Vibrio diazotrophicus]
MAYESSIREIYNGLVHQYQFEQFTMLEPRSLGNVHHFWNEKPRDALAKKLEVLGQIANDLCQPQLADKILNTANELSSDGVPPMPM